MQQEMFNYCTNCGQGFMWTRVGQHSRLRLYCPRCERTVKREQAKNRKRRQRARNADSRSGSGGAASFRGAREARGNKHNHPSRMNRQSIRSAWLLSHNARFHRGEGWALGNHR